MATFSTPNWPLPSRLLVALLIPLLLGVGGALAPVDEGWARSERHERYERRQRHERREYRRDARRVRRAYVAGATSRYRYERRRDYRRERRERYERRERRRSAGRAAVAVGAGIAIGSMLSR